MNESILVVDDERPMRFMVRRLMEGMGYTVSEAGSGDEALKAVEEAPVDLVITDLKMPGMDGLTLAKTLLNADPDRPVLLMTAYADLDSARRAIGVGIYEYFTKPFDVNDVSAGVRRALEHRRLVMENRDYQKNLEQMVEERTRELMQKLQELEARDRLLQHLLSIQEPQETLGLAVQLALSLCACDAGALYVPDADGEIEMWAAVGYLTHGAPAKVEDLTSLGLERTAKMTPLFQEALQEGMPTWTSDPGEARGGFGIHSVGILPVRKEDEVIALLEVDRKRKDALVGEADLDALQGFLPYVAMSVADCRLQTSIPDLENDDVEDLLKKAEKWMQ